MYAEWRRGCGVRCVHVWGCECMQSGGGVVCEKDVVRCVHVWSGEGVWCVKGCEM